MNVQSTTVGMGKLVMYAASSAFAALETERLVQGMAGIAVIWPNPPVLVSWPPERLQITAEIDALANALNTQGLARATGPAAPH